MGTLDVSDGGTRLGDWKLGEGTACWFSRRIIDQAKAGSASGRKSLVLDDGVGHVVWTRGPGGGGGFLHRPAPASETNIDFCWPVRLVRESAVTVAVGDCYIMKRSRTCRRTLSTDQPSLRLCGRRATMTKPHDRPWPEGRHWK